MLARLDPCLRDGTDDLFGRQKENYELRVHEQSE